MCDENDSLDLRRQKAIQAALARQTNIPDRGPLTRCATHYTSGRYARNAPYDPFISSYLNYRFGEVVDDWAVPFHIVPNPTGEHDVMYVVDIRVGEWSNPLANDNIEEVFDPAVRVDLDERTVNETLKFLREGMEIHTDEFPPLTTYYSPWNPFTLRCTSEDTEKYKRSGGGPSLVNKAGTWWIEGGDLTPANPKLHERGAAAYSKIQEIYYGQTRGQYEDEGEDE
ncbi:hypothetical protein B0H14DRAFT_3179417 [Mycena olivaceomarginata]|nr:hypothetical protein B0H14DRAFT_3179417 [Mycena olivaceomarginata]